MNEAVSPPQSWSGWLFGLGLIVACLWLNIHEMYALKLDRFSTLWINETVPAVISDLQFNGPGDYTALDSVRDLMTSDPNLPLELSIKGATSQALDQGIRRALAHRGQPIKFNPYLVTTDDKGVIDFIKGAFLTFGYHYHAILRFYWLLFGGSCLIFFLRFSQMRWPIVVLAGLLLSHCAAMNPVSINPQLRSFLSLRFLSVLGMAATLHLALEVWYAERLTVWRACGILLQVVLLVLTLHIRFATIWEIWCVVIALAAPVLRTLRQFWVNQPVRSSAVTAAFPVTLLICATLLIPVYQRAVYAADYYRNGAACHFFWHSVVSGFAYSPELAKEYAIKVDDSSIYDATRAYLETNHRTDEWEAIKSQDQYDDHVKELFFSILHDHPQEVFWCVVYHKPLALAGYIGIVDPENWTTR
jgi:hypothetical protein